MAAALGWSLGGARAWGLAKSSGAVTVRSLGAAMALSLGRGRVETREQQMEAESALQMGSKSAEGLAATMEPRLGAWTAQVSAGS